MARTLVLPDGDDVDVLGLAEAAYKRGWAVRRLADAEGDPATTLVYGPEAFCRTVAQKAGLRLFAPDPAEITTLPAAVLNRALRVVTLVDAWAEIGPFFAKGVDAALLPGATYADGAALQGATADLPPDTRVIVSEIVTDIWAEARCFVSDARVVTASIYEGDAELMEAAVFASTVTWDYAPPFAFVLDVAFDPDRGWCVLALRPVWSADLYDCDPATVLDCLENAMAAL